MKNVTGIVVFILSVIIISSLFVSCGNGNKHENTIIGKWEHVTNGQTDTMEFLDNGKFNAKTHHVSISSANSEASIPPEGLSVTGDYTIDGDKIICDYEIFGAKQEMVSTFTVDSTTLTLTSGGTETSGIKTVERTVALKHVK